MMTSTSDHIAFKLLRLNRLVNGIQLDIPTAQLEVLLLLDEHGAMNLSDLAGLRRVKMSTMSVMMEQMLNSRLVLKANSKSDRRQRIYLITNFGKLQLHKASQTMQSKLNHFLSLMTDQELAFLNSLADRLSDFGNE